MSTSAPSIELRERLIQLAEAQERDKSSFIFATALGARGTKLIHDGLPQERSEEASRARGIDLTDLQELDERELIEISWTGQGRGTFRVTAQGKDYAHRLRRASADHVRPLVGTDGGPPRDLLAWKERALPVLRAAYIAYAAEPGCMGVSQELINAQLGREPKDATTDVVLAELQRAGYVEATVETDQGAGPIYARPTEKALQLVAGWPGDVNADTAARLIAAIEKQIEDTDDPVEKSKWMMLRDGITGVGRDLFVDIVGHVVKGEL